MSLLLPVKQFTYNREKYVVEWEMPSLYDSYIICCTPRTGSTLLCDLLASTEVAGEPDSFFMQDLDPIWLKQ